nr:aminopeptidase N [Quadrisphaera setariae]
MRTSHHEDGAGQPADHQQGMNLSRAEAAERAALVDVSSYDVELDLTTGPTTFRSRTTVRFSAREGASTFLDLVAPHVHELVLNGEALDAHEVADGVRVQLHGLAAENEVVVVADCAYMNTGEGLHRFVDPVDGEVYLYSQFEVADSRRVFAVFEQPDLKAVFTFTVTAPDHWTVVSVSPTPEPSPGPAAGSATWRFAPTPVLSSYVTAVVAGPYHVERGELTSSDGRTVPLGVFCRRSLAEHLDAGEIMDITRAGFAFYEGLFEIPYPFPKYDQLFVPEFNAGAMENAGAVTFLERYVFRSKPTEAVVERRAVTILHELAHMWFGDLVTMRWWDDLWLNESFAEYASTLATAEATRWTDAWTTFASMEKAWAYRQDQLPSTHPIVADMVDLEAVEVNFDGITYAKGASVLKQLVTYVGRDAFFEGVRRYLRAHSFSNATLADLLRELEATSGRDLASWSSVWLEKAGVTTLKPEVHTAEDGSITSLVVTQTTPPEHPVQRPHRLAVGFYDLHVPGGRTAGEDDDDAGDAPAAGAAPRLVRTGRVEVDVDGERTDIASQLGSLSGRDAPDLLLLNDDDLAYAKIRLDPSSLATAVEHLSAIEDALPRTLVWSAAWDMARDAEMAARDFVDLVLDNAAVESTPATSSVLRTLLQQLTSATRLYTAPGHRDDVVAGVAASLMDLALAAEPGSDAQLQLATAAAGWARTPAQLDAVAGWLSGDAPLEGLSVDTDLRWELLTALVVEGRAGEAEIAAELARDDTASGRLAAAGARAAIPDPAAKQAAWSQLVASSAEPGLANAERAAVIGGFARVHDAALLEPFVEPYFASIEGTWRMRTNEIAQQVVTGLYPVLLASPALLERTDAWLAQAPSDLPALKRLVSEQRDGVARALRAQERDLLR